MFSYAHLQIGRRIGIRHAILATAVLTILAAAAIGEDPEAGGVLVLTNGKVIEGRITREKAGFLVEQPGGKLLVPEIQVRVYAADRQDAYRKLRTQLPLDRPDPHVSLARWCIVNEMYENARHELGEALHLVPSHPVARQELDRLNEVAAPIKTRNRSPVSASPIAADSPLSSRVLVTVEGRIIEGRITRNAGGYLVENPGVRFVVPDSRVKVEAADRQEAYLKQRDILPPNSPDPHVKLARWCLTHHLHDSARRELLDALRLAPDHAEARSVLKRLEETTNPETAAHRETTRPESRTAEGFDPPDAVSLGGLTPKAAREFVARVQPVLMNKCGNASCHAAFADHGFDLIQVHRGQGAHRAFTERNLANVLRYIDRDDPEASPLLKVPDGDHGRNGRPVFHGRASRVQRDILLAWVREVAPDAPPSPTERKRIRQTALFQEPTTPRDVENAAETIATQPDAPVRTAGVPHDPRRARASSAEDRTPPGNGRGDGSSESSTSGSSRHRSPRNGTPSHLGEKPLSEADERFLQRILREERPDAFDPDEFNRRFRNP